MQYNIYSKYNAIALQEAVEEIDVKRQKEKAFIDHSAISWHEDS